MSKLPVLPRLSALIAFSRNMQLGAGHVATIVFLLRKGKVVLKLIPPVLCHSHIQTHTQANEAQFSLSAWKKASEWLKTILGVRWWFLSKRVIHILSSFNLRYPDAHMPF